jgi:hypothetical protein
MLACAIAMAREYGAAWVGALRRQAAAQRLSVASEILASPPALRRVRRLADPHVYRRRAFWLDARPLWGRRVLETSHSLERLLQHPDSIVARHLLAARSLKLTEALAIASRRPTKPAIVAEVLSSPRWVARVEVRTALVFNPFVEPGISLKLLPTVPSAVWRELAAGSSPIARAAVVLRRVARDEPAGG